MASLGTRNAEMWEFEEFSLDNSSQPSSTSDRFDLGTASRVTFRHTSGETLTTRMFYDGSDDYKFRFTGTLAGRWTFETDSSDRDLDGFTGTINVSRQPDEDVDGFLTSVGNKFAIMDDDANDLEGYLLTVYMNQAEQFKQGDFDTFDWANRSDDYLRDALKNGAETVYVSLNNNVFSLGAERDRDHNSRDPDTRSFDRLDDLITTVHGLGGRVHFWMWGDRQRGWVPKDGAGSEADKRIQSYIAARLGPLPGWSMGYSFDAQEWTSVAQVNDWANRINGESGWDHLLFARGYRNSSGPNPNGDDSRWTASALSGHSYSSKGDAQDGLQTSPVAPRSIEEVIADINSDRDDPHFYEERFTYNRDSVGSTGGPPNDADKTRRLKWWTAMSGGVGNWIGFFDWPNPEDPPYPNQDELQTHYEFWHEKRRFDLDLQQANGLADSADTHILRGNNRYIVYAEDRDNVQIDLPSLPSGAGVIAVDTKDGYRERNLGGISQGNNRSINLPYRSDWALVIESGSFSDPTPDPEPTPTPDPEPTPTPDPEPTPSSSFRIQAEDYTSAKDNDSRNLGGQYRDAFGVDIERTSDSGGGFNVGWTRNGEELVYRVNVAQSGTYDITARVAARDNPGRLGMFANGQDLGDINVPRTGGWQAWTNVTQQVSLSQGTYDFKVVIEDGAFNLNYFDFNAVSGTFNPPSNPPPSPSPGDDVLLYWALDEGSGTVANDSSANRDGTLQNGAAWTGGKVGSNAVRFDGNDDQIIDADAENYLNGLDAITVAMWVNSDRVDTDAGIFTTNAASGTDGLLGIRYDDWGYFGGGDGVIKVGLQTDRGSIEYESAAGRQTTGWQHIAMTWKAGDGIDLFINGVKDRPTFSSGPLNGRITNVSEFLVGVGSRDGNNWDGNIDDVLVLNRELSDSQVASLAAGNYSGIL